MFRGSPALPVLFPQGKYVIFSPWLLAGRFALVRKVMESSTLGAVNKGTAGFCASPTPAPHRVRPCLELEGAERLGARSCSPRGQRGVWRRFPWKRDPAPGGCRFGNDCWKCRISAACFLEQCGQTCKIISSCFSESPDMISFEWGGMRFLG